jgi:hypothetical protein
MSHIFAGRYAAHADAPFVLFLIGVNINKPLRIPQWMPAVSAMLPMISQLRAHPEKGMIDSRTYLSFPTILIVQYWRSFEQLEAFARDPDDLHIPAWKRFYHEVGKTNAVGIFHETYLVNDGQYEAVYANMPRYGLGKAMHHSPATGQRMTARRRLGGQNEPAVELTPSE